MADVILAALLGALLSLWLARAWRRARMRRRFRKARAGEIAAEQLLKRRGFRGCCHHAHWRLTCSSGIRPRDFTDNFGDEFLLLGQDQLSVWAWP
jgi:hypothetical protein